MLAWVFQLSGLTALALAYVMEEGLPRQFFRVPIEPLEAAAKQMHGMGYEKVGLWGISKGAELALTAGSRPVHICEHQSNIKSPDPGKTGSGVMKR